MKFFTPFRPLLRGWLISFAGWSFVAGLMITRSILLGRASFEGDFFGSIRDWLPWAILTPLLFRLVARFPIDRETWRRNTLLHICCAIVVVSAVHIWKTDFIHPPPPPPHEFPPHFRPPRFDLLFALSFEIPIYVMIISAAHTLHFYRRREVRKGQLAIAQLHALQARLEPHFLFNTLNTIAGLVHKAPDKAEAVLTMLSDLLRFALENGGELQVPLEREIEFIRKYLAIMQVRYEQRVQYELEIEPDTLPALIPPLLLQPIVENAIKYGVEPNLDGGKIRLRTWRDGNQLRLNVSNTGSRLPPASAFTEGIGFSNTRARLRELFGTEGTMNMQNGDGARIEIAIPFRT
jgi:hypothetical protein